MRNILPQRGEAAASCQHNKVSRHTLLLQEKAPAHLDGQAMCPTFPCCGETAAAYQGGQVERHVLPRHRNAAVAHQDGKSTRFTLVSSNISSYCNYVLLVFVF
jgi:hypothetical protein